jgi:phosphoglycolate phosphatase-like HAD superfamily hydrolase
MHSPVKAVLFDLDGVLVHSPLDLAAIKRELFGDEKVFIIEGIEALDGELEAAGKAHLDPGVSTLFDWIENRNLKRGVITRNTREAVALIARNLEVDFGVVIAREDAPPKPDPASVHAACDLLGVRPEACVMVGDFTFDIEAGRNAGCRTVFIETEKFAHLEPGEDVRIKSLVELIEVLEGWIEVY